MVFATILYLRVQGVKIRRKPHGSDTDSSGGGGSSGDGIAFFLFVLYVLLESFLLDSVVVVVENVESISRRRLPSLM
jgi:hypothetical protein